MINREKEILEAFVTLGYKPRDNQVQIISDVVAEFIDKKKKNVMLIADTGVGKSLIGAVVSEVLSVIEEENLAGIFLSSTNSLTLQYADSFKKLPDMKFFRVKGAGTYPCEYFKQKGNEYATGDDCVKSELTELEIDKYCKNCEYKSAQKIINKTENLITNYAYFMISKLKSDHLAERNLQVFDEAHLLNDVYCSQVSIDFSVDLVNKLCKDLDSLNGKFENEKASLIIFKNDLINRKIHQRNYLEVLKTLADLYNNIGEKCNTLARMIPDMKVKAKTKKVGKRFLSLASLIGGLFTHKYDHVFDDTVKDTFSVKPIFIGDMMHLLLGRYNLFMTATMSPDFAETTMKLAHNETAYIEAPGVFPAKNKPIFFVGKENLNYQKMSDPQTYRDLVKIVEYIVEHHKNDKGIIIVPSFHATKQLSAAIPKSVKLFQHLQGTNVADTVIEFKKYNKPAVLISPSIFEGLDLPDDLSRYQIILKAPFPGLSDPRIKKIADQYGSIYKEITLYKILQGIGRSIRSKDDTAATYCLDKMIETLFKSKLNIWQDRFDIKKS